MKETVEEWLKNANKKLKLAEIKSPQLDAELILAKVLDVERTSLHAYPHKKLTKQQVFHANNFLKKRSKRVPLAYIFGEKEFFGRKFKISCDVLVPRPESESLILLYKKIAQKNDIILDVGTGSGILANTVYLENKDLEIEVFASDISKKALKIAKENSEILNSKVDFFESDLLESLPNEITQKTNVILANLPYVNTDWIDFSKANELHFEPQNALYAEDGGLALIKKLIQQSDNLACIKFLILEADPDQFSNIEKFANNYCFVRKEILDYGIIFEKV